MSRAGAQVGGVTAGEAGLVQEGQREARPRRGGPSRDCSAAADAG